MWLCKSKWATCVSLEGCWLPPLWQAHCLIRGGWVVTSFQGKASLSRKWNLDRKWKQSNGGICLSLWAFFGNCIGSKVEMFERLLIARGRLPLHIWRQGLWAANESLVFCKSDYIFFFIFITLLFPLVQSFSKFGIWTTSTRITWKLLKVKIPSPIQYGHTSEILWILFQSPQ